MELVVIIGLLLFLRDKGYFQNSKQIIPAIQDLAEKIADNSEALKQPFPELYGPVSRKFDWEFKGVKYSLDQALYESVYGYYKSEPKTFSYVGELKPNWEEEYYGSFLVRPEEDKSISELATKIQELGKKHKLSDDQIVDLTLAFVQSIPYDDAKAKNILAKDGSQTMLYPYETLFEQKGVCSDKSLLATVLLRQMGYGAAIFAYNDDNHMAIGIQCPKNYSTYGSGYCFAETTSSGNKIGIIPSFDAESNKTVDAGNLPNPDSNQSSSARLGQLGQVTMFQKTSGREYAGIIQTEKILKEIEMLKKIIENSFSSLQSQKKAILDDERELKDMQSRLNAFEKSQNFEKYNTLAEKYNALFKTYKKEVEKYNNDAALYNKSIARYNELIKQ